MACNWTLIPTLAWRLCGVALVAAALMASVGPGRAGLPASQTRAPLTVQDDNGGRIVERLHEIRDLRRSGRDVRIVGSVCYSTCTMLIGLPTTCVSPRTVFGFHGPSRSGQRLETATFERASMIIAAHYPPAIRTWYLREARYTIGSIHRIRGSALIAMGIRAC